MDALDGSLDVAMGRGYGELDSWLPGQGKVEALWQET